MTEGGQPVAGYAETVSRGSLGDGLEAGRTTKMRANGNWSAPGKLKPKKTTFFQVAPLSARATTPRGLREAR